MADEINQGGTLAICAAPQNTDLTQVQFEALTYINIGRIVTMPQIGITTNIVQQDYVNTAISQKQKGVLSGNDTEIVVGNDALDAGQDALRAAAGTKANYAFVRTYTEVTGTGFVATKRYFRALVGEAMDAGGGVEDFENETFPIYINGQRPIRVESKAP